MANLKRQLMDLQEAATNCIRRRPNTITLEEVTALFTDVGLSRADAQALAEDCFDEAAVWEDS